MFADNARIYVEGGRGGNGCVSFRREARVAKGGPDGGDGGRGGDVVLVADESRRDLNALRRAPHLRAGSGAHGQGNRRHGARGEDRVVLVPPGTQIEGLAGAAYDLVSAGQRATVAKGGSGGHGNKRFAGATRQSPRFAERGLEGECGWIDLQMKLLADVGLIGLPNAGKSSLLGRLTRAAPKVADYPFTTVEPVLGTLEAPDRQLVIADIPGLIEGAAEGAGLGLEFLAHVERCRALVHLVEIGSEDRLSGYEAVRRELSAYGAGLDRLPELLVLSKSDLVPADERRAAVRDFESQLGDLVTGVVAVSSATGHGLDELRAALDRIVPGTPPRADAYASESGVGAGPSVFESEHRIYRPAAEQGYRVSSAEDGVFEVEGRGVEVLVRRHDLSNAEALAYLEQRLREMGVVSALRAAGFENGDEVRIGEQSFELDFG